MSKLLVVVGATGQQGSSVIKIILEDDQLNEQYKVRGLTRDPSKSNAQDLAKKGVEVVQADIDDAVSLRKAFEGAHTVFAYTITIYDGHTLEHEIQQGRALADAAVAAGVPFYIWSTLPNAGKNSGGILKNIGHFDGKEEVEQYIRGLPIRSSFISPGSFMTNFKDTMAPRTLGDGTYGFFNFVSPKTRMPLIDTAGDTGKWVAAILADFPSFEGKVLYCSTAVYTFQEIATAISEATGKTVLYKQVPEEMWRQFLPPTMKDHIAEMFHYIQDYGYYGDNTEEKIRWSTAQAHGALTTLNEYLLANPIYLQ